MGETAVMGATEFKAKCLEVLDRIADGSLTRVTITKRNKVVGELVRANAPAEAPAYGFMKGTVHLPPGFDLTEPICDEPFDAELGILHR